MLTFSSLRPCLHYIFSQEQPRKAFHSIVWGKECAVLEMSLFVLPRVQHSFENTFDIPMVHLLWLCYLKDNWHVCKSTWFYTVYPQAGWFAILYLFQLIFILSKVIYWMPIVFLFFSSDSNYCFFGGGWGILFNEVLAHVTTLPIIISYFQSIWTDFKRLLYEL